MAAGRDVGLWLVPIPSTITHTTIAGNSASQGGGVTLQNGGVGWHCVRRQSDPVQLNGHGKHRYTTCVPRHFLPRLTTPL